MNQRIEENNNKRQAFFSKTIIVIIGAVISSALWGSAFPCVKIGYEMMNISSNDTSSQILYAGLRFFLAGIIAYLIGLLTSGKAMIPKRASIVKKALCLSLFQTILQYLFFYIGLSRTSGVKASIIEGMNVFMALIIAAFIFRQDKMTVKKALGCLIGFAGVVLVNLTSGSLTLEFTLTGDGFIFISTISYAFSTAIMKLLSKNENPVLLSSLQFIVGGIVMMIVGVCLGGSLAPFTPASVAMLIYLAIVSSIAYTLWGILLKYNPVSKVAVFGFLTPVFGVLLSAVFLGEATSLSPFSILALALVCFGIYIVNKNFVSKKIDG